MKGMGDRGIMISGGPDIRGDGQVPVALDQIPAPMVIALLRAGRNAMRMIIRRSLSAAELLKEDGGVRRGDDNSRRKVPNLCEPARVTPSRSYRAAFDRGRIWPTRISFEEAADTLPRARRQTAPCR